MKMIITGVNGLLGRTLAKEARQQGWEVTGVARCEDPGVEIDHFIGADLSEPLAERDWRLQQGAAVFHLAANTRVRDGGADFVKDNVITTKTACELSTRIGGRLVLFSSSAVYSGVGTRRPLTLLKETDETKPGTAYGVSKKEAEAVVMASGLDAVICRIFGVLSGQLITAPARGNLIQAIVRAANHGETLTVRTDDEGRPALRDYALAEDVCRAALRMAQLTLASETHMRTVNLCTGIATSSLDMVRFAQKASGKEISVQRVTGGGGENDVMVGDPAYLSSLAGAPLPAAGEAFWTSVFQR